MRVELNQGTYRIRPSTAQSNAQARRLVSPTSPVNPTTSPTNPLKGNLHSAGDSSTISRGPDVAELASINFKTAQKNLPQIDRFHAKMSRLVAAEVNRPVSFDSKPNQAAAPNIYHRAYLRQVADHASLNATAVERERLNTLA